MVNIGDRKSVPVHFLSTWKEDKQPKQLVGTVIALHPRFAVVQFPCGVRECYPYCGPENIG